jgi:hypothetical protein
VAYYGKLVKGRRTSALVQRGEPIILHLYATAGASLRSGKPCNNAWNRGVLHARDPRCHWCGIVTVIAPRDTRALSHYHATVDHVFGVKSDRRDEIVLACHGCNTRRGELSAPRRHIDPERRANTIALLRELTADSPDSRMGASL